MINIFQLLNGIRNPQQLIQQLSNNSQVMENPMAKNAMQMFQNGDTQGLQKMAENLAKERGTTIDEVRKMLMSQFGMK
jgi:thioredoxin-like negative regulator of GroEL